MKRKYLHPETLAIHAQTQGSKFHDVTNPIHLSTTFNRDEKGKHTEFNYTRAGNPNRIAIERVMASLEGGADAMLFSSGMAAINALFENILEPYSHVIIPDDCYHGTKTLLHDFFSKWKVECSVVDMTKIKNIENALNKNTKLIWLETPSNPQLKIADIKSITNIASKKNILTACDNTFATPLLQKPFELGVEFVMHSSTKFFAGHSDILSGVVITKEKNKFSEKIRHYQGSAGAVPSPFDCWLLGRSLSTLPLRFKKQCENANRIAEFFSSHSKIEKVFYPGLKSHVNHNIASRQMKNGFGSIISVLVKGGRKNAFNFASRLNLFRHATSLGGVESLVEHRRSTEGALPTSPDNLLRFSIGIEYVEDLIWDIENALK